MEQDNLWQWHYLHDNHLQDQQTLPACLTTIPSTQNPAKLN